MLQRLLGGATRGGGRQNSLDQGRMSNSYVDVTEGDTGFTTSALVAAIIQANTANPLFSVIWEHTVPAGQLMAWGHGNPNQQRNQGFGWFAAADLTTDLEEGTLRLQITTARNTRSEFITDLDTRGMHTQTVTTMATLIPLTIDGKQPIPFTGMWVKEDSKLQLLFRTRVPGTTVDACDFSLPVTIIQ